MMCGTTGGWATSRPRSRTPWPCSGPTTSGRGHQHLPHGGLHLHLGPTRLRFYPRDGHYLEVKLDRPWCAGRACPGSDHPLRHREEVVEARGTLDRGRQSAGKDHLWAVHRAITCRKGLGMATTYAATNTTSWMDSTSPWKGQPALRPDRAQEYYPEPIPPKPSARSMSPSTSTRSSTPVHLGRPVRRGRTPGQRMAGRLRSWAGPGDLYDQVLRVEYSVNALAEGGLFFFSQPF